MNNKKENPLVSLLLNIVIPVLILTKAHKWGLTNANYVFALALSFPLGYALFDYVQKRQLNTLSVLGIINVLISHALNFFQTDLFWFAVKEAAIPSILGIALLATIKSERPLVKTLIFNDQILNLELIEQKIKQLNKKEELDQAVRISTYWISVAFLISAFLNFLLARILLKSPPGTEEFNAEFGYMTAISYPIILGSTAIFLIYAVYRLIKELKKLTGLELEEILAQHAAPKTSQVKDNKDFNATSTKD